SLVGRPRLGIGGLEDGKTLGVGLHQPILDAVVNHLDEMAGTARAAMHVALLRAWIAAVASGGALDVADAGRERGKNRIEAVDGGFVAADHQAIAALEAPDAAAGANVEIMNAFRLERAGAAHVVLVERVAAIDHDIAGLEHLAELSDRIVGHFA